MGINTRVSAGASIVPSSGHAAIYTRISEDKEGEGLGVARQLEDCEALAARLNLDVSARFEDNDTSASTNSKSARPQYDAMLARARSGEFTHILAYSSSRLSRRPREQEDLIELSIERGTAFTTVTEGQLDYGGSQGRMIARIIGNIATGEAEWISDRVKRAARQRVESGRWHGGIPPYGYRKEDKALFIREDEAARIKDAAHRILDRDETLYSIIRDWNRQGIKTRGNKSREPAEWRHSVLKKTLMNKALIGLNSVDIPVWEPILDRATFDRLNDKLAPDSARITNPLGVKSSKYVLGGGLVRCAHCGKGLSPVARGDQATKLVCRQVQNGDHVNHPKRADGTSEGRVSIDHDALERYLFHEAIEQLRKKPEEVREKRVEAGGAVAQLRVDRENALAERDRAGRAFIAGIMSEQDAQREVARLNADLERIDRDIERASGKPTFREVWAGRESDIAKWPRWDTGERRVWLRFALESVVVGDWPEKLMTTTLPKKGETPEDFEERRAGVQAQGMAARVKPIWK